MQWNIALIAFHQDCKAMEEVKHAAATQLPPLEEEFAQLKAELDQEQADVAEIEGCDQEYLNELKAEIAEQEYVLPCVMFSEV
jgi:kinetochore protein Spc7/SPC105